MDATRFGLRSSSNYMLAFYARMYAIGALLIIAAMRFMTASLSSRRSV